MASEGQSQDTREPAAAPVQSTRALQWEAILAAVKDQLPSLDSDASTVSAGTCLPFPLSVRDISEEVTLARDS